MDEKLNDGYKDGYYHCEHQKIDSHVSSEQRGSPWIDSTSSVNQRGSDAGYVRIATGPNFGCVHHESRTQPDDNGWD